jgi:hypothetical protein
LLEVSNVNRRFVYLHAAALIVMSPLLLAMPMAADAFSLLWTQEPTIADIHAAIRSKDLMCRQLVQMYVDRIEAYDKRGPSPMSLTRALPNRASLVRFTACP